MDIGAISHPNVISTMLTLLWSINERVGGKPGIEAERPNMSGLVDDWLAALEERSAQMKEAENKH